MKIAQKFKIPIHSAAFLKFMAHLGMHFITSENCWKLKSIRQQTTRLFLMKKLLFQVEIFTDNRLRSVWIIWELRLLNLPAFRNGVSIYCSKGRMDYQNF